MTKVLHGIVHGKFIEVTEDLGLLDGQAVELIVTAAPSTGECAEGSGCEKNTQEAARTTTRMEAWFHANGCGDVGGFVDGGG